jgi:hypothetical protein
MSMIYDAGLGLADTDGVRHWIADSGRLDRESARQRRDDVVRQILDLTKSDPEYRVATLCQMSDKLMVQSSCTTDRSSVTCLSCLHEVAMRKLREP